jgi:hypothetical protein
MDVTLLESENWIINMRGIILSVVGFAVLTSGVFTIFYFEAQ